MMICDEQELVRASFLQQSFAGLHHVYQPSPGFEVGLGDRLWGLP